MTYDTPVTFPQQTVQYQPGPVNYQAPGGKSLFFQYITIEIKISDISDTLPNNIMLIIVNCPTGLASFGGNFLTTAIQVILGLFTFSLLLSVK